jgi:hypothetical protein
VIADVGVFTAHIQPAVKVLSDGRNAYLIQQPSGWWLRKFLDRFELGKFDRMPTSFMVVV